MIEAVKIEEAQIIPNNNPNLYIVEPFKSEDGESVHEYRLVPIVGWYINTSLTEPYGNLFSDAFAIPIGQLDEDDPVIFDKKTKQWSNANGMGTGEAELLKFLNEA